MILGQPAGWGCLPHTARRLRITGSSDNCQDLRGRPDARKGESRWWPRQVTMAKPAGVGSGPFPHTITTPGMPASGSPQTPAGLSGGVYSCLFSCQDQEVFPPGLLPENPGSRKGPWRPAIRLLGRHPESDHFHGYQDQDNHKGGSPFARVEIPLSSRHAALTSPACIPSLQVLIHPQKPELHKTPILF